MNHRLLAFQPLWKTIAVFSAVSLAGCALEEDFTELREAVESFEQKLVLEVDGRTIEIPLEKMDIFLTEEEEYPETFEIYGTGVVLVGTFPKDVRVDYGEHWARLVGREIAILPNGGEHGHPTSSEFALPGQSPAKVLGGNFTVEKFSEGFDAKTPLTGRMEIKVESPEGEKTYRGKFTVKGTTWG